NGDLTPKEKEAVVPKSAKSTEESVKTETTVEETTLAKSGSVKGPRAQRIPSIEVSSDMPTIQEPADSKPIVVIEPEESRDLSGSRRSSSNAPVDSTRRDSSSGGEPSSPIPSRGGSRRPSIIIVADEKGLAVDESGQTKKLRPGEMLEVRRGSRRGSMIDMRK